MIVTLFFIIALIFSAIIHEYAHGWVALKLGDHTAEDAGRLTLNPLPHLDPVGSILLPMLLLLSKTGFFIAWAKPVPYNPNNLRDQKYGDLKVALGGPGSNLLMAVFFGILARLLPLSLNLKQILAINAVNLNSETLGLTQGQPLAAMFVLSIILCFVNLILMLFNLIPVPPLDGSKIILPFLSYRNQMRFHQLSTYGFIIILFLAYTGIFGALIGGPLKSLFSLFTGVSLT
jgi:Zn-dependent protease